MDAQFYLGSIKITQVPNMADKDENESSWLTNPFVDSSVYGTKFTVHDEEFSWKFFLKENSKERARQRAFTFLDYLKETYPGIAGDVEIIPLDQVQSQKGQIFFELILPQPPFNERICLLKKIINLFSIKTENLVELYILWQRDDSIEVEYTDDEIYRERNRIKIAEDIFKVKVYISLELNSHPRLNEKKQISELQGHLEYLITDIKNVDGERAKLSKEVPNDIYRRIFEGEVFWKNQFKEDTGAFYNRIKNKLPQELIPSFINPQSIDFSIPEDFPLDNVIDVRKENIIFTKHNPGDIFLGLYIRKGVKEQKKIYFPPYYFVQNVLITGQLGTGKTSFNAHVWKQFKLKQRDIGGFNINYLKRNQGIFYDADIYLDINSADFEVSYYYDGDFRNQTILQTAYYLTASQGLNDEVAMNLSNLMKDILEKNGRLPLTLKELFEKLIKWLEEHPYSLTYQTDIMRMLKTRILDILSDPKINRILRLSSKIPTWFKEWRKGKKIYLDLSMCNIHEKRLLTFAIFHMMGTLTPTAEVKQLQNFIQIDEAFDVLAISNSINTSNYNAIALDYLQYVFEKLVKTFRSKGIGVIISDPNPSNLFKCILSFTSIKILFRTVYPEVTLFANNMEDQDYLSSQKKRRALVINGITGEKYAIYTPDFSFPNNSQQILGKGGKICPNCSNIIDNNSKYCGNCNTELL